MTSAMATTPPVLSPSSTLGSGGMFCSDQLYESPRLTGGIVSSFISSAGGGDIGVKGSISGAVSTNECKMVEVHGVKVASFKVDGQELICLPQVFDLFLKHLVGGLHTVYTKLKRLDICPVVCTVEQVRILRGLGAIQPGVNRCKLISRKDFEALYNDCTNASSRPGRPPKRSLGVGMQDSPHLLHHGVHSLLAPSLLTHTGLTAAAMAEAMKLQKMKLMMNLQSASTQNGSESEPEDTHSNTAGGETCWEREKLQSPASGGVQHGLSNSQLSSLPHNHLLANKLDLPFMMMPHPLLPVSLPPASVAMAMNQMNHLNTIANMAAAAHIHSPLSRATSVIKQERMEETPSPAPSMDGTAAPSSQHSSQQCSSSSSTPTHILSPQRPMLHAPNGELSDKEAVLHVRKAPSEKVEDGMLKSAGFEKLPAQMLPSGFPGPLLFADSLSSVETLLTNIQGLLKVAVENARVQDKQLQQERKELKMELYREREMRESLERQLTSELHSRATIQRRLKKEKKAKRKLQEALEFESKRREQVEQALQQTTSPDTLRMSLNEAVLPEMKAEHNGSPPENSTTQESRAFMKTPIMF